MASLGHEAVVRVLCPKGEDGGHLFFVMELVPGGDLQHAVAKGRVLPEHVGPILLGVGGALAEAHAKGIVHRDVKPANILLDGDGAPRLTDFDLVTAGDTTGGTRTGAAMGSWVYMAPEQRTNAKQVDARADVYALGMTALFCLHGGELPDIREARPEEVIDRLACPAGLKWVLRCAIAVKAAKRYADARAFCEALREALQPERGWPPSRVRTIGASRAVMPIEAPVVVSSRVEMVRIPGGFLWMGSSGYEPGAEEHEVPRHQVVLSPYWMAKTPITQRLYFDVTKRNPSPPAGHDLPISEVSWEDAVRFCNRLSELEGLALAYREAEGQWVWDRMANGFRLPSEAEWEYAARGPDGRAYPWGHAPPSYQLCWSGPGGVAGANRRLAPSPVGSYPAGASPFGLLDMAGNVWEWCWDWYAPYPPEREKGRQDPKGPDMPTSESCRITRGGSWLDSDFSVMRTAYRSRQGVSDRHNNVGFRCARGMK
jgi:formylglycine-generating enzyme required for sulfatase activity